MSTLASFQVAARLSHGSATVALRREGAHRLQTPSRIDGGPIDRTNFLEGDASFKTPIPQLAKSVRQIGRARKLSICVRDVGWRHAPPTINGGNRALRLGVSPISSKKTRICLPKEKATFYSLLALSCDVPVRLRSMGDYYSVITRAVARLESNTPVARKAVFDRARTILAEHLRIRQPPASHSEIARESAALEDAIRRTEAELAIITRLPTELARARAPLPRHAYGNCPLRAADRTAKGRPRRQKYFTENDHRAKTTKAAPIVKSRHWLAIGEQCVQTLRNVFKRSRMMLGGRRRAERLVLKDPKVQVDRTAPPLPYNDRTSINRPHALPNKGESGPVTFPNNRDSTDKLAANANIPIFNHLLGIQWLDQLMRDAAYAEAPNSLKEDARTVLHWLGVDKPGAISIEHYEQFARGFQSYITECQTSSVGLALAKSDSPLVLNDDIRSTFNRLLEREQTARVFDKALLWFATVWIRVVVAINVIAVVGLVATAPNLWIGVIRLSAASNVWNLAAEIVALSPALVIIAWLHQRLKHPRIAALTAFTKSMVRSLIAKLAKEPASSGNDSASSGIRSDVIPTARIQAR